MSEEQGKSTIKQASIDAKLIVIRLQKASIGEIILYSELSSLIGKNVQKEARFAMETARRIVLRENDFVFDAVRGVGLKRLSPEETIDVAGSFVSTVRKSANRAKSKLNTVDPGQIGKEHFAKYAMVGALISFFRDATKVTTQKKIEASCQASQALPGLDKLIECMRK